MHLRIKGIHFIGFREDPNGEDGREICSLIISGRGFDCLCTAGVRVAGVNIEGHPVTDYPTATITPMGSSGKHGKIEMALIQVGPPCRHEIDPGDIDELEVTVTNANPPESDTESVPVPLPPGSDPGPGP